MTVTVEDKGKLAVRYKPIWSVPWQSPLKTNVN